ncbi:MAG: hypothetical protein ACTHQQ_10470 [Solirubrobacteraceae bacterium]
MRCIVAASDGNAVIVDELESAASPGVSEPREVLEDVLAIIDKQR